MLNETIVGKRRRKQRTSKVEIGWLDSIVKQCYNFFRRDIFYYFFFCILILGYTGLNLVIQQGLKLKSIKNSIYIIRSHAALQG